MSDFAFNGSASVATAIRLILNKIGIRTADIDMDPDIEAMDFEDSLDPESEKRPAQGSSCADELRGIIDHYAIQGQERISVTQRSGRVRVWLSPYYDGETVPEIVFMGNSQALPPSETGWTDTERYEGIDGVRYFNILSETIDFTIARSRGNSLAMYTPTSREATGNAFACFVEPHPDQLHDPEFWNYEGRLRPWVVSHEQAAVAGKIGELARFARKVYDSEGIPRIRLSIEAEWQPGIWPDDLVWIQDIAIADSDEFEKGDVVSYGAWRIDEITVHVDADDIDESQFAEGPPDDPSQGDVSGWGGTPSRKWSWTGQYSLVYMGVAESDDIKMFSDVLPDYGRPEE